MQTTFYGKLISVYDEEYEEERFFPCAGEYTTCGWPMEILSQENHQGPLPGRLKSAATARLK